MTYYRVYSRAPNQHSFFLQQLETTGLPLPSELYKKSFPGFFWFTELGWKSYGKPAYQEAITYVPNLKLQKKSTPFKNIYYQDAYQIVAD